MNRALAALGLCWLVLVPACSRTKTPPAEAVLTREEVLNYLDGKELPLVAALPGEKTESKEAKGEKTPIPTAILHRSQIAALEPQPGVRAIATEPWTSTITFLYDRDGERYAVEATVDHKIIEGQRAFFAFRVKRVARQ